MVKSVAADIATIGRINAVPAILQVICETTGIRFAAVARVTDTSWTACAVRDELGFGLEVGGELPLNTTLCDEIRGNHQTIIIDKASEDPCYHDHHTPRIYRFESYISVPVFRADGSFFGTICALDPNPVALKDSAIQPMMESFARLLSIQMESDDALQLTEAALLHEREVAELREQFIAVLGHDLRNPLFAINAGAEMLLRRAGDERSISIIEHIITSGNRASRLVEDVLDFARGRLGSGMRVAPVALDDLADALKHVVSEVHRVHPQRVFRLNIGDLGGLRGDRERIAQLCSNLVANAIHHGASDGAVDIEAKLENGLFSLSVHNQGEPIAAEVLAQLFQPFTRRSSDAPHSGLGLGLYIADQIARAHGGYMDVASTRETGTLFSFKLPLN
jgi:signal transduction histidine kinase